MCVVFRVIGLGVFSMMLHVSAFAGDMCKIGERAVFNCELDKSIASLCFEQNSRSFVYRDGTPAKIDLVVPAQRKTSESPPFYFSNIPYSGGGEVHVRFRQGGYQYYLYDKTVRTDDGPDFSAGIVVYKNNKKVANLTCNNDASVHQEVYEMMPKEAYRDIGAK